MKLAKCTKMKSRRPEAASRKGQTNALLLATDEDGHEILLVKQVRLPVRQIMEQALGAGSFTIGELAGNSSDARLAGRCRRGRRRVCRAQAVAGTGRATSAFAGDAEFPAQVPQRAGAAHRSFANLAVGYCPADTDIH